MAKKKTKQKKVTAKRKKTGKKQAQSLSRERMGGMLLAFSILLILSLQSFSYGESQSNALGLVGYTLGWSLAGLFGLGSYIVCGYTGWVGWRMLFNKPINHPFIKHFHMGVLIVSFGMLLTVIEEQSPTITDWLGNTFFKQSWNRKIHFHMGGAPLYYLYNVLSNLQYE